MLCHIVTDCDILHVFFKNLLYSSIKYLSNATFLTILATFVVVHTLRILGNNLFGQLKAFLFPQLEILAFYLYIGRARGQHSAVGRVS